MSYKILLLFLITFATTSITIKVSLFEQKASRQTVTQKNNPNVVFIPPKEAKPKETKGGAGI